MKTHEEMAEECKNKIAQRDIYAMGTLSQRELDCLKEGSLAGYKAAAPQWISVEDARPEWASFVHVITDIGEQKICRYFGTFDTEIDGARSPEPVTHWMPLPNPPENPESLNSSNNSKS